MDAVEVLVGGSGLGMFSLEIFQDNGATPTPGPLIYTSAPSGFLLTGPNNFNVINLASEGITIANGSFRIVLVEASGVDSTVFLGRDTNGITPQRNTVRILPFFGWQFYENTGGSGDLIIRAQVTPIPEPTTAAFLLIAGITFLITRASRGHPGTS